MLRPLVSRERPPKPAHQKPKPPPSLPPAEPFAPIESVPPGEMMGRMLGRWKRVSHWWCFSAGELEAILAT